MSSKQLVAMKEFQVPVSIAAALLLLASLLVFFSPSRRTGTYVAIERNWTALWPLERGKYAPLRVRPAFQPLVPIWHSVAPGVKMLLDPEDLVSHTILTTGSWEPHSWAAVKRHLPVGGTFVDVGAHIGYYSLLAARSMGPRGQVIAVEPNPETLAKLRENVRANPALGVTIQPVACSATDTTVDIFAAAEANTGESSMSRKNAEQAGTVRSVYRVRARPLDDIVGETGVTRVDAIKIDVEGAELLVLEGATRTLARFSPMLIVEIIDQQLRPMGASAEKVVQFLREQGYSPRQALENNVEFTK